MPAIAETAARTCPARYWLRPVTLAARSRSAFKLRTTSIESTLISTNAASMAPKPRRNFLVKLIVVLAACVDANSNQLSVRTGE